MPAFPLLLRIIRRAMAPRSTVRSRDLGTPIDRNLALELVRVTEGAAMAAARFMGRDNKEEADRAAVDSMRRSLGYVDMDGVVVIGEGEKDRAPMLYIGEHVGNGTEPNLRRIARAEGRNVQDLTVVVLDRERHDKLLREIRAAGARVKLIMDGDVAAGLMAAMEHRTGIDVLMGIGGAPEAVLAACAIKCVGGGMQARLWPRDAAEGAVVRAEGKDPDRVLSLDELCAGANVFFAATGITDGELLQGVRFRGRYAETHSLVMRSYSGTIRYVEAQHDIERLQLRPVINA